MSTVTVPQVNPNDEVTALSVNQGPNAIAAVLNGNVDDANISTLSGSKISAGTLPASALDTNANPETRESETMGNFVASGLIWSALTGLNATMTSGVAYVNGKRLIVATVATNAFTASRDTYVYVDNTGTIQYNAQTNGATQPATPANNQLIAKVITSGAAITSINDLRVTSVSEAWRSFVPILTNLSGGTINYAKFKQVGTTVHVRFKYTLGGAGITGAPSMSLPVTASADYSTSGETFLSMFSYIDVGVNFYAGNILWNSSTTAAFRYQTGTTMNALSSTAPFTWGSGDFIQGHFSYEAA